MFRLSHISVDLVSNTFWWEHNTMQCYGLFAFVHPSNSMLHNTQIIADLLNTNPPRKQTSDTNAARPNNKLPILHGIFSYFWDLYGCLLLGFSHYTKHLWWCKAFQVSPLACCHCARIALAHFFFTWRAGPHQLCLCTSLQPIDPYRSQKRSIEGMLKSAPCWKKIWSSIYCDVLLP